MERGESQEGRRFAGMCVSFALTACETLPGQETRGARHWK
jgi:hypothetical protein